MALKVSNVFKFRVISSILLGRLNVFKDQSSSIANAETTHRRLNDHCSTTIGFQINWIGYDRIRKYVVFCFSETTEAKLQLEFSCSMILPPYSEWFSGH